MSSVIDATESEVELRMAVYGLIRMLKPEIVVETGSYKGAMTHRLGKAVKDNGNVAIVISVEPNKEYLDQAIARCESLPVKFWHGKSEDCPYIEQADFLFLDSDYKYRRAEIARAKVGATIVVHDAFVSYDPHVEPLAKEIVAAGGVCFPCGLDGRGFGIMVKR